MLKVRSYGSSGPRVIVVHGGPGACGSMAQVARGIEDSFRVFEPFQSSIATTVADHVADLHEVVEWCSEGIAPALVGHSWGAMLVLAYAAKHPGIAGPIVLVCSGTFDLAARDRLSANLAKRMDQDMRRRFERVQQLPDPNDRFRALGNLTLELYSHDLATTDQEIDESEPGSNHETWEDMVRLQNEGVYPGAFAAIKSPVLMLHGAVDPHPGEMIRASLERYIPRLDYREWERCGHYPWLEKATRDQFFSVLRKWLADRLDERPQSKRSYQGILIADGVHPREWTAENREPLSASRAKVHDSNHGSNDWPHLEKLRGLPIEDSAKKKHSTCKIARRNRTVTFPRLGGLSS